MDPLPPLLASQDKALTYFTRRDLQEQDPGPVDQLWALPDPQKILKKQLPDGSWTRPGDNKHPAVNVRLVETFRYMRFLVEQYGFTREHPQLDLAAEYIFTCQTLAGDFRGILANQYATYYTGAILSLLVKAGYQDDPRVEYCFQWLLNMRQADGGWTIPMLTHKLSRETQYRLTSEHADPLEPNRSMPFSHNWTGMVLRAFAEHPLYRRSEAARHAAQLLKSRFFLPDCYTSYQDAGYWLRFEYPFWWNNLVAALDSISKIDPTVDGQVRQALGWLSEHQCEDGLWKVTHVKQQAQETAKSREMKPWISLAICRVLKRFFPSNLSHQRKIDEH